eukprot:2187881-Prymnesium_polylepis.1
MAASMAPAACRPASGPASGAADAADDDAPPALQAPKRLVVLRLLGPDIDERRASFRPVSCIIWRCGAARGAA